MSSEIPHEAKSVANLAGILNCHKPRGVTSRDVVNRVQRLLKPLKVGHAGTLDPLATGVLLVAVGWASRLIPYLQQLTKEYKATFLLGRCSDSLDIESPIEEIPTAPLPPLASLEEAAKRWTGHVMQTPPVYSALKVKGKRACDRARRGEEVILQARPIQIDRIALDAYAPPEIRMTIVCGSGTYVRSLGDDIAKECGSRAVMSELVRTRIGAFPVSEAVEVDRLDKAALLERLAPPERAVAHLPTLALDEAAIAAIEQGQTVQAPVIPSPTVPAELIAVDRNGRLRAILIPRGEGHWRPRRVFPRVRSELQANGESVTT